MSRALLEVKTLIAERLFGPIWTNSMNCTNTYKKLTKLGLRKRYGITQLRRYGLKMIFM